MKAEVELRKLDKAHAKYEGVIGDLEGKISALVEFDFSIFYQPSDGFVMLHNEDAHNAPLGVCLNIIERKGKLSYEDYMGLRI